ncbi:hypothetical protein [Fundidesulfovibrio putealis]|uniref:hypothetical protein n=1 Tax=Fundidesulfovibrio putealis TaxID=270496 RepID=UPI00048283D2|nr:hypothetical protein [Fundidesulfovibrio putealis]
MNCKQGFKSLKVEDIERALCRAAEIAKDTARLHGTPLVVWENGKLVEKYLEPKGVVKVRSEP